MKWTQTPVLSAWRRPFQRPEYLAAFALAFAIYGDAFPYGVPLYAGLCLLSFSWFGLIRRQVSIPLNTGYLLTIFCAVFYVIGVIHTATVFESNWRDLRNIVSLLALGPVLFALKTREDLERFTQISIRFGVFAGTTLAVVGLYKFHLMARGETIGRLWIEGRPYPWGTSLIIDYNFYAFAMLCGAISCLFCLVTRQPFSLKVFSLFGLGLNTVSMSLSGSRRGWVTEGMFLVVVAGLLLYVFLRYLRRLAGGVRFSGRNVLRGAVLVGLLCFSLVLVERHPPAFLESNREDFQVQLHDLQYRLETLTEPGQSFDERSERWKYSAELLNGFSSGELWFGEGFAYLPRFATKFANYSPEDYPHDPILSALLYSGIAGGLLVAALMLVPLFKYLVHVKRNLYFGTLYFASLWFVLPSFNSVFSGKFLGILLLLPWVVQQASEQRYVSGIVYRPKFVRPRLSRAKATEHALGAGA